MNFVRQLAVLGIVTGSLLTVSAQELFPDIGATEKDDPALEQAEPDTDAAEKPAVDPAVATPKLDPEQPDTAAPKQPAPDLPDTEIDLTAATTSISKGVAYLRHLAAQNESGLFIDPTRRRRVVETKTVERRYRRKVVEIPIYKYKYEEYEVLVRKSGSSVTNEKLKKVTRKRVKSRVKVGTKKVVRTVRDPDGPIVKIHKVPVYDRGGDEQLFTGFYAQNAQCIYALIRSGEDPGSEVITKAVDRLNVYLIAFGLPDHTADLAWLLAAYSNLHANPENKLMVRRFLNKLLLGQVVHRDAAGMWGPVCINHELLAEMIAYEQDLYRREIGVWESRIAAIHKKDGVKKGEEAEHKPGPTERKYLEKVEAGKEILKKYLYYYRDVSVNGRQFEKIHRPVEIVPGEDVQQKLGWGLEKVFISGLTFNIYLEQLADLESTALALFALYEAKSHGHWIKQPQVPPRPGTRKAFLDARSSQEVVAAAYERLKEMRRKEGFAAGIMWLPQHSYDDLDLPGQPVDDDIFVELPNGEPTAATNAAGYAALSYAAFLRGSVASSSRSRSERNLRQSLAALTKDKAPHPKHRLPFLQAMVRAIPFHEQPVNNNGDQDVRNANALIGLQFETGAWYPAGRGQVYRTPAENQRWAFLRDFRKKNKGDTRYQFFYWRHWGRHNYRNMPRRDLGTTTEALVGLSCCTAPLVVADWDSGKDNLDWVVDAVADLPRTDGKPARYAILDADFDLGTAVRVPVITITGSRGSRFSDAATKNLKTYLTYVNGTIIATGDKAWLTGFRGFLKKTIPDTKDVRVQVGKGKLPAMQNAEGRTIVVFILPERGITGSVRRRILTTLLKKYSANALRAADDLLDEGQVTEAIEALVAAEEDAEGDDDDDDDDDDGKGQAVDAEKAGDQPQEID